MTDIVKGMARAYLQTTFGPFAATAQVDVEEVEAMRAALLWLAEQFEKDYRLDYSIFVPTEHPDGGTNWEISHDIAAAIRAAAGGGE